MERPNTIAVLYNTDYDAELTGPGVDESSVQISARAIVTALQEVGYQVELIGIEGTDVFQVLEGLRRSKPDLVFNLCESMAGDPRNEPTFAGLLDVFAIPYTGADLLALASCLHKQRTKEILTAAAVPTPPYRFLRSEAEAADPSLDALDYPWFLKLAHEDASVGITEASRVTSAAGLRAHAVSLMREFDQPVLAEKYIEGREVNVTLLGNGADLRMLPLHEIDFAKMPPGRPRIVSYAAKWEESHVDYAGTKPVPMRDATPVMVAAIEQAARGAWHAMGLRDYGRVDLRVDSAGTPWVIDVNPNCDISPDAGVARSARVAGYEYPQLVELITQLAWARIKTGGVGTTRGVVGGSPAR